MKKLLTISCALAMFAVSSVYAELSTNEKPITEGGGDPVVPVTPDAPVTPVTPVTPDDGLTGGNVKVPEDNTATSPADDVASIDSSPCTKTPDCDSLGYTSAAEDCDEGIKVACPTDNSKFFCKTKSGEAPLPILYGDGTVDKKILADKTPIGVVFDETEQLAIAFDELGSHQWNTSLSCDVGVTSSETSGKLNTMKYASRICGTFTAVKSVIEYAPAGCSADFCKAGKWFVPSLEEMKKFYSKPMVGDIDETMKKFNKTVYVLGSQHDYWSSNEYKAGEYTREHMYTCTPGSCSSAVLKRTELAYVRPAISYRKAKEITCVAGSILYEDQKCYDIQPDGLYATAVVVNPSSRLAIALSDSKNQYGSSTVELWGDYKTNVSGLSPCAEANLKTCDTNGRSNTDIMLRTLTTGAAFAVNKYTPLKCSADFCQAGKWFLPSVKEWYAYNDVRDVVDDALSYVYNYIKYPSYNGAILGRPWGTYWSSNEGPAGRDAGEEYMAWYVQLKDNKGQEIFTPYSSYKQNPQTIRPFVKY